MHCANAPESFKHINDYFKGECTGHFLLINAENFDEFHQVFARMQADSTKTCVRASQNCMPNGLPNLDGTIAKCTGSGDSYLIGISQAAMLRSAETLKRTIGTLLEQSVHGHCAVLLSHCGQILKDLASTDIRINNRVVWIDGEKSKLPKIKLVKNPDDVIFGHPIAGLPKFLKKLEDMTDERENTDFSLSVLCSLSPALFKQSVFAVGEADGIYESLIQIHQDIAGGTHKTYGNDEQWKWLAKEMTPHNSFSDLVCEKWGSTDNLSFHLNEVMSGNNSIQKWFLWLSLMVFGERNNPYLELVLSHSENVDDFEEHIYLDLCDIDIKDKQFETYLAKRRILIARLPENPGMVIKFCDKLGKYQKDEIFYLSDASEKERYEFVRCLSIYEYTKEELERAVKSMSKSLQQYLRRFTFDQINTRLSETDAGLREELTKYFEDYKLQKLTNRIYPEFLQTVNQYAVSRPYNKLQARSSIVSHLSDREKTTVYFFDALGVEYLSFILAKCEEYGLMSEVSIGRCELPSITVKNKEFLQYFPKENQRKIDELDEMKHDSPIFDYQKCEYPIHLFSELDVINKHLCEIRSQLTLGIIEKATIIADHGASRLAVRYANEIPASVQLEESGEHSGRCCPAAEDPGLPFAAYEDGYSILANYDRFKGGRKSDVEVHGGASLEEVLVPVIILTKKPEDIEICLVHSEITIIPRVDPELVLYSNISLEHPRIFVNGDLIEGEFVGDNRHAKFVLKGYKRRGNYKAEVYDGDKNMSVTLEFTLEKKTRENNLF